MCSLDLSQSSSSWAEPDGVVEVRCEKRLGSTIAAQRCLAEQRAGCSCARMVVVSVPRALDSGERLGEVVALARLGRTHARIADALAMSAKSVENYRRIAVERGMLPAPVRRVAVVVPPGVTKACVGCGRQYGPRRPKLAAAWLKSRFCAGSCYARYRYDVACGRRTA